MKLRLLSLSAAMLCLASWQASAQTLNVGDNAPALAVSRWVKGEKIEKLDKEKTYVVEFWATWCGPCRVSIPHLTELQKKYKDKGVRFIGVSVWEQEQGDVEPFVAKMGDKMEYSVALDDVPKGEDANSGKMAKNWMTASGSQGIPTAFIVKGGKVIWIGHPMEMEAPLEKCMKPNFDLAKFVAENREEMAKKQAEQKEAELAQEKLMEPLQRRLTKLGENATPKQLVQAFTEAFAEKPELEPMFCPQKYMLMIKANDKEASTYGMKLVEQFSKDDPETLNILAWSNLSDDGDMKIPAAQRDAKLALKASLRANELTKGEVSAILDTLALAYFKTNDAAKALETQEKAMKLLPAGDESSKEMKERLEMYKKAVAEKKKP